MRTLVPSISALRAFEATARHGSFTRAAAELNVTQAATSQQVKGLESYLGVTLFIRSGNGLILTDAAQRYLVSVRSAIELLAQSTEDLVQSENDHVLTVNSLATFTFRMLLPHLADFRARHPDIGLRVSASVSHEEFDRKPHDAAIRLGYGDYPGMRVDPLFEDRVFPVCSPVLLARWGGLSHPEQLARHVLLRSGFSFLLADAWPAWLRAAGVAHIPLKNELAFEFAFAALDAANQGLGIALGRGPFVQCDLAEGRLIKPFDIEVSTGRAYYLTSPIEVANRPKVKLFREWLLERVTS
ncbi:transcriptional regulator GcvA [Ancylobacter polymorphus]|uniref:LysR family glycine cleavage system transcriptional activator n=1 Tax=Ancylobacter polymorphus TaxID=223390 RepID=A0ABU0BG90_9HYPH|nr:transcriptional regulator GcvA [Ancylobacter polymorphus]MDQ0304845.1 LysR family glycine cleavage system transcriptional activator [Ancylobacter polymorphus]